MEPLDRYAAPQAETTIVKPLGSLAQSARGKEIGRARGILIGIGILTMVVNGFFLSRMNEEIDQAVRQNGVAPAAEADFRHQLTIYGYEIYGIPALLGVTLLVFGLVIRLKPVLITTLGLILYLAGQGFFAYINPPSLAQGIIVKIIVVVALYRAIKAAQAYESETVKAAGPGGPGLE